ncbi:2Fe-2S iron-sulfur cluster-binding protein [Pseudomonas sp. NFACC13-1]|uniref:2Fe-2S iron-sulfur cluster-binding protein n=1 Tax=Pseudomonas sp. NFACC13-1 TaxID=1566245 RepID=UPI0008850A0D|nr:2Fe-2S iron-sulfur cluster-binding protein [Pseudomonas sp. NFACC13-1]SDB35203.1 ferredoxin, 2Fe-2S [Pseudomonas sp. NFACC13-1]
MPLITFVAHDGSSYEVQAAAGSSLMQVALANGIDGILGECGGSCSCATCHCYLAEADYGRVSAPGRTEREMLECVSEPQATSRLGCQVIVTGDMEGMVVHMPASQY